MDFKKTLKAKRSFCTVRFSSQWHLPQNLAIISVCFLVAYARPVGGQETTELPLVLFLCPPDNTNRIDSVKQAILTQLSDLDVSYNSYSINKLSTLTTEQIKTAGEVADKTGALAVLWIDETQNVTFYMLDVRGGKRLVARDIRETEAQNPGEAIGVIARLTILELLESRHSEETPVEADAVATKDITEENPAPSVEEKDEQVDPKKVRPVVQMGYLFQVVSSDVLPTHGLAITAELEFIDTWAMFVSYNFVTPIRIETEHVEAQIQRHPVCLGGSWHSPKFPLSFGVQAAGCVDFSSYQIDRVDEGYTPESDLSDVLWSIVLGVDLVYCFHPRFGTLVGVQGEVPVAKKTYTVVDSSLNNIEDLHTPWPVQPRILLAVFFKF